MYKNCKFSLASHQRVFFINGLRRNYKKKKAKNWTVSKTWKLFMKLNSRRPQWNQIINKNFRFVSTKVVEPSCHWGWEKERLRRNNLSSWKKA